ncbi:MAG: acetyl-CoA carboxylase biotin carboxyl carrier protein [bacterium]
MRFKDIERIVEILETSSVSEIEVSDFLGRKIRITKCINNTPPVKVEASSQPGKEEAKKTEKKVDNLVAIKSPIVGTFYRSPAPDAPPYIDIGDVVKPGQVVCIVEAMKLMNEIESDVAGKIVKMLVKNEDPVEYNQELFMVEPL